MSFTKNIKLNTEDILDNSHMSEGIVKYLIYSGINDIQRYHGGLRRFASSEELTLNSGFRTTIKCIDAELPPEEGHCGRIWTGHFDENDNPQSRKTSRVYSKIIHLVDPFEFMQRSKILSYIPAPDAHDRDKLRRHAISRYNQASVDATICYMLSRLGDMGLSPATIKYYETICGIADNYNYRITDDFDTYRTKHWFWSFADNGKLLRVEGKSLSEDLCKWISTKPDEDELDNSSEFDFSELREDEETECEEVEDEDSPIIDMTASGYTIESICEEADIGAEIEEEDSDEPPTQLMRRHSDGASVGNDSISTTGKMMEELENANGEIYIRCKDIPVLVCFQEAAEGTMDELLSEVVEADNASDDDDAIGIFGMQECEKMWAAWLFQICAALSVFQKYVNFCHNDLHTNNIVWVNTKETHLHYKAQDGTMYRVPTYGKIFKLIDFGRATAEIGDVQIISTDYEEEQDAWGQYNWGPFRDENTSEVAPNPSFDLSRLAVSLFETLYPGYDPNEDAGESDLAALIWSWLQDDEGKSILYDDNDEERFPGFELYVHIARYVHGAVPAKQFSARPFAQFKWRGKAARSAAISPQTITIYPIFTDSESDYESDSSK